MTATTTNTKLLIVIAGATASGKTDLSIDIARHYNAPIISTDSRQVYRGMPIGTAQPSSRQLQAVPHHFISCFDVTREFNCGEFEKRALSLLDELFAQHQTVVAVGGSGLYIKALCEGIDDLPTVDKELRNTLTDRYKKEGLAPLVEELERLDPVYYKQVDINNPARVMRALEVCLKTGQPYSQFRSGVRKERDFNIIKIGISVERNVLYERINRRVDKMIADGLVEEARALLPYRECNALHTVGYSELFEAFDGRISMDEAVELIKRNSRRYAKRQITWFGRDDEIKWFEPNNVSKIIEYIDSYLFNPI